MKPFNIQTLKDFALTTRPYDSPYPGADAARLVEIARKVATHYEPQILELEKELADLKAQTTNLAEAEQAMAALVTLKKYLGGKNHE